MKSASDETPSAPFGRGLFRFLSELSANNERPWFEKNKHRYEAEGREPMLALIAHLQPGIRSLSPCFNVDPRPVGGSMMRIYRDIRFSKDKSPYKTALAAHFEHRECGNEGGPGFYLHIGCGSSMVGGGVWRPAPAAVLRIRRAIAADPDGWRAATSKGVLGADHQWHGESLKRPPKGFSEDHPYIEDLKRKDFAVGIPLTEKQLTSPGGVEAILDGYRRVAPMIRFLCGAQELEF